MRRHARMADGRPQARQSWRAALAFPCNYGATARAEPPTCGSHPTGAGESSVAKREVVLSGRERVPYPEPTSSVATRIGRANSRTNTKPELLIRSELHRRGHRFRKDLLVRTPTVRTHVDVAFTRRRLAVFIDGCFWHACPDHGTSPRSNTTYWGPKLAGNVLRDRRVVAALEADGWTVLRIWEHEPPTAATDRIEAALRTIG